MCMGVIGCSMEFRFVLSELDDASLETAAWSLLLGEQRGSRCVGSSPEDGRWCRQSLPALLCLFAERISGFLPSGAAAVWVQLLLWALHSQLVFCKEINISHVKPPPRRAACRRLFQCSFAEMTVCFLLFAALFGIELLCF